MGLVNRKKLFVIFIVSICTSFFSCGTTPGSEKDHEKRIVELESSMSQLKEKVLNLERDNDISKKLISAIQNDLQSQNEEISTQKKNIAILNRGLRSGIFEELPGDKNANAAKNLSSTMLPDFTNGRSGFHDASGTTMATPMAVEGKKEAIIEPKDLLASAEIKIRKSEYREGLMKLDELRKKFPNYDDNGRSFLLAAEAWLKLKEYNNVVPEIRDFYLKYQTSADLAYAKLLEGQAHEGNGSFEKAAMLYNEVISLSPQSTLAQTARDGMLRMRDQK